MLRNISDVARATSFNSRISMSSIACVSLWLRSHTPTYDFREDNVNCAKRMQYNITRVREKILVIVLAVTYRLL